MEEVVAIAMLDPRDLKQFHALRIEAELALECQEPGWEEKVNRVHRHVSRRGIDCESFGEDSDQGVITGFDVWCRRELGSGAYSEDKCWHGARLETLARRLEGAIAALGIAGVTAAIAECCGFVSDTSEIEELISILRSKAEKALTTGRALVIASRV